MLDLLLVEVGGYQWKCILGLWL